MANLTRIFVGNLPWTVANRQLIEYFSKFGPVASGRVIFHPNGISKGYGFIDYFNANDAETAKVKKDHFLEGNRLEVDSIAQKDNYRSPLDMM